MELCYCHAMQWHAHATVAAIIRRGRKFLFVEEQTVAGVRLNQPAGHLEDGETLLRAVERETLEETGCRFTPEFIVGIYQLRGLDNGITYLRVSFAGRCQDADPARALDPEIIRTLWLDHAELKRQRQRHRSPLVQRCVDDFLAGNRYPLDLIAHLGYQR